MLELKFPAYLLSTEVKKIETSFLEKKTIDLIRQKGNINVRTLGELTTAETKYPEIVIPIIEECIINPEFDYEIPTIILFLCNYKPTKKYINIELLINKYKETELNKIHEWSKLDYKERFAVLISTIASPKLFPRFYTEFLTDESLGDTRVWFLYRLDGVKSERPKLYEYLVTHKDKFPENSGMYGTIKYLLSQKKYDEFKK